MSTEETPELWRPVKGFPDYEVARTGAVRRLSTGNTLLPGKMLSWGGRRLANGSYLDRITRLQQNLRRPDGKWTSVSLPRLVVTTWGAQSPGQGSRIVFVDGNRENCAVENLRWTNAKGTTTPVCPADVTNTERA